MQRIASSIILSVMLLMTGILLAQETDSQMIVDNYTDGRAYAYLQQISVEPITYKLHLVFPDTEIILPEGNDRFTTDYSLSPDGTQVVYTVQTGSGDSLPPQIYNLSTGSVRNAGEIIASDFVHVEWSPDGTEIAFFDYYGFFSLDLEDNSVSTVVLTFEPYHSEQSAALSFNTDYSVREYYEMTWGADNNAIASIGALQYSNWEYQRQYLVNTETGDFERYDVLGNTHLPVEYSPDGDYLAILSSVNGKLVGTIVTTETGDTQDVIADTFEITWDVSEIPLYERYHSPPVWSPDSSAFAFVVSRELYIVNRFDGSTEKMPIGVIDAVVDWLTPELLLVADYIEGYQFRMLDYNLMTLDGTRFQYGDGWSWDTLYEEVAWLPEIITPVLPILPSPTPAPILCEDSLGSRLTIGSRAFVVISPEGEARTDLRVRTEPSGEQVASMSEGTQFIITDGPICSDGLTWWQLETLDGAISGWSAESIAPDTYLIQPDS